MKYLKRMRGGMHLWTPLVVDFVVNMVLNLEQNMMLELQMDLVRDLWWKPGGGMHREKGEDTRARPLRFTHSGGQRPSEATSN